MMMLDLTEEEVEVVELKDQQEEEELRLEEDNIYQSTMKNSQLSESHINKST